MSNKQWFEISATGVLVFIILNIMFIALYMYTGFKEIIWIGAVISFAFGLVCGIGVYTLKEYENKKK